MKRLLFFISLISFISCEKEKIFIDSLPTLTAENLKEFLPLDSLAGKTYAVFSDQNGNIEKFRISIEEKLLKKVVGNKIYDTKRIQIIYYATQFSPENFFIQAISSYDNENGDTSGRIFCGRYFSKDSYLSSISIDENGNPISSEFYPEFVVGGKKFYNVYAPPTMNDNGFSYELYYSKNLGLIGFLNYMSREYAFQGFE